MGLDVGDRRVGVAISDDRGQTAQPLLTLHRKDYHAGLRQDLRSLARLARRHNCDRVVVGNPLYMSGDKSPQAEKVRAFAEAFHELSGLPLIYWDERLTTTEAHRHLYASGRALPSHRAVVDQVAAVLILQSWLDAQNNTAPATQGS
jgi:putative Holliday junction resolvase